MLVDLLLTQTSNYFVCYLVISCLSFSITIESVFSFIDIESSELCRICYFSKEEIKGPPCWLSFSRSTSLSLAIFYPTTVVLITYCITRFSAICIYPCECPRTYMSWSCSRTIGISYYLSSCILTDNVTSGIASCPTRTSITSIPYITCTALCCCWFCPCITVGI